MSVDFPAIIAKLSQAGPNKKRSLNVFPQRVFSDDEMKAAEKRVEQNLLMHPSSADIRAAEEFLYPDSHFAGRTEYTDEEHAAVTRLAYELMRRRHIGNA